MQKLLVINDLHPRELPGAASIALDMSKSASHQIQTTFLFTTETNEESHEKGLITIGIRRKPKKQFGGYLGQLHSFILDCFGIRNALYYRRIIRSIDADFVWFHQIGNHIPRLTVFFLGKRVRKFMTLHDFNLIVPRKLYPRDLTPNLLDILSISLIKGMEIPQRSLTRLFQSLFYFFRRLILRAYLRNCELICISQLQRSIYEAYAFHIETVIPNGIDKCHCESAAFSKEKDSILFVGRLIGKGLERLLRSAVADGFTVYLVGSPELSEFAKKFDANLKYRYLGRLTRDQVFQALHQIEFTYVASDCFDVFPTIGLEAIRHGSIPITSESTGIRDIVRQIHPQLVVNIDSPLIPLKELMTLKEDGCLCLDNLCSQLLSVATSTEKYLNKIRIC